MHRLTRAFALSVVFSAYFWAPSAVAQSVLILDDSRPVAEAALAAEALGYDHEVTFNVAAFQRVFDERDRWDIVVIDASTLLLPQSTLQRLTDHIDADGSLILSYHAIRTSAPLRALLNVTCHGDGTYAPYERNPDASYDIFSTPYEVPSPMAGIALTTSHGGICTFNAGDETLAILRYGDAIEPGIVLNKTERILYNAVLPDAFVGQDINGSGIDDAVALYANQLRLLATRRAPGLLVISDEGSRVADAYAAASAIEVLHVESPSELFELRADGPYEAVIVEFRDLSLFDVEYLPVLAAMRAEGTPLLVFAPDIASNPGLQSNLGIVATPHHGSTDVQRGDQAIEEAMFRRPRTLDALVAPPSVTEAATLSGPDMYTLARFGAAGGDPAILSSIDPGLIIGGIILSDFLPAPDDDESLEDEPAVIALGNLVAFAHEIGPIALLLSDAGAASPARDGARLVSLYPLEHRDGAQLLSSAASLDHRVTIIESVGTTAGAMLDDLDTLIAISDAVLEDRPLVLSAADLGDAPVLGGQLGVVTGATVPAGTNVVRNPGHLGRVFSLPSSTPATLIGASSDGSAPFGVQLSTEPGVFSAPIAHYASGGVAAVSLHNGRTIISGFSSLGVGRNDTDLDRTLDGVQWMRNQLHAAMNPQMSIILDDDTDRPSVLSEAAQRVGLRAVMVDDAAELAASAASPLAQQIAIDSSASDTTIDVDALALLALWIDSRRGALIAHPGLANANSTALRELLEVDAAPIANLDRIVESAGDTTGSFESPNVVPSPINGGTDLYGRPGASLSLQGLGETGARYSFNRGPVAGVFVHGGTTSVSGFAPRNLVDADVDGDNVEDRVEYFANQMVRVGRVPVPVLTVPPSMDEGTTLSLDASSSFDPSGETITFAWDLTGDGAYTNGSGPSATLDATTINGNGVDSFLNFGLQITNVSGLTATARYEILVDNVAPNVNAGPDRVVLQGEAFSATATVTHAPGEVITVSWDFGDGSPIQQGLSVSHAYSTVGEYTVNVVAEDDDGGVGNDSLTVTYQNVPPTIDVGTYDPIDEGTVLVLTATASDPGDDPFTVSWEFGDGGSATGLVVNHRYLRSGIYTATATATEIGDPTMTSSSSTTITVENIPPIITSEPPTNAVESTLYTYAVEIEDPGDDQFTYTLLAAPPGMEINLDGVITWIPGIGDYDDVSVHLRVSDGTDSDEQDWVIEVDFLDTDGGGAPDSCELRYGFDIHDPLDDQSDPDGDGLTVAEECLRGSDPTVFSGPMAPTLIEPIGGLAWTFRDVDLLVENTPDPDGDPVVYDYELYTDFALTDLVEEIYGVIENPDGATSGFVDSELEEDRMYYWRARGRATDVTGPWSETESFIYNIVNEPPGRPEPISPIDVSDERMPTLRVENAIDPDGDVMTYTFELYLGANTRTENLLWSATEVPSGPSGETSIQIDIELEERTLYTWRARAVDTGRPPRSGPFAVATFRVDTTNTAPSTPVPTEPVEGDRIVARSSVTLAWENSIDDDGDLITYFGDLASDEDFQTRLGTFQNIASSDSGTTRVVVPVGLNVGTTYHWRVAATDGRLISTYGVATFETQVANSPPTVPIPRSPIGGATVRDTGEGVTLTVENATDPDEGQLLSYDFQIATDVAMRTVVHNQANVPEGATGMTSHTTTSLLYGQLFWRVRAFDGQLHSPWSDVVGFVFAPERTSPDPGPPADAGLDPDIGDDDQEPRRKDSSGCQSVSAPLGGHLGVVFVLLALGLRSARRRQGLLPSR